MKTRILTISLFLIILVGSFLIITSSCRERAKSENQEQNIGGPCSFSDIPGYAIIQAIEEAPADQYNCPNDPVEVRYNFFPDDSNSVKNYRFPDWSDENRRLTIGAGMNPPREWVERESLLVEQRYQCIRHEIQEGTCTPVYFEFPEIDFSKAGELCY
ncbi:MAG: hypothetical protein GF315_01770 [candidate division Zixibacteria bacterium]|nr:hypothetical protein [candidate division Zixibacteria bacterium]